MTQASRSLSILRKLPAGALLLCLAAAAYAHPGHDGPGIGGFMTGVQHPFAGLDHLLAMLAVGIWAATQGRPRAWALPLAFALLMAAGAALGMAGVSLPAIEPGIAASVIVLGLALLSAWRAPAAVALGLVAVFGVLHGFAHGAELPANVDPLAYGAGFLVATFALHAMGVAIGLLQAAPRGALALRAGGAAIAAAGAWLLLGAPALV
ncbi:HupE/UreJ family protein [uncultured Ramlibacter sp.]|uniref:HupE/UreJ family protein n=1 Tax=uncultured Ramlibacter sp. TaxID=260755 RepID=UPI00261F1526|nr:HupE/UreJ family protein [uncultured Ramlibacter sp.]